MLTSLYVLPFRVISLAEASYLFFVVDSTLRRSPGEDVDVVPIIYFFSVVVIDHKLVQVRLLR